MLRLEPGDVALAAVVRRPARKRTNAVILWVSRRTDFCICRSRCTSGSDATISSALLAMREPPQQRVEQREALRIAVADRRLRASSTKAGRRPRTSSRLAAAARRRRTDRRRRTACHDTSSGSTSRAIRPRAASRNSSNESRRCCKRYAMHRLIRTAKVVRGFGASMRAQVGRSSSARRPVVGGDDERPRAPHRTGQPRQIVEPQACDAAAPTISRSTVLVPSPGMRSSSSRLAVFTSIGKASAVAQRPGELRIDVEIEHAVRQARGDLVGREAIEAEQPVGLIEPVFARERGGLAPAARGSHPGSG